MPQTELFWTREKRVERKREKKIHIVIVLWWLFSMYDLLLMRFMFSFIAAVRARVRHRPMADHILCRPKHGSSCLMHCNCVQFDVTDFIRFHFGLVPRAHPMGSHNSETSPFLWSFTLFVLFHWRFASRSRHTMLPTLAPSRYAANQIKSADGLALNMMVPGTTAHSKWNK